ncbi:hypothetical protein HN681_04310 [archaeon]|nr:hypothetical protein [archaeon]MBT3730939.1 hypothetical protein [archaeon]MBT4669822.1 hypothetical protein [archaeon]MBT5029973.1 hypothetical protein [archaeon]MBT5288255.1 hypothetical protein [archaeon]
MISRAEEKRVNKKIQDEVLLTELSSYIEKVLKREILENNSGPDKRLFVNYINLRNISKNLRVELSSSFVSLIPNKIWGRDFLMLSISLDVYHHNFDRKDHSNWEEISQSAIKEVKNIRVRNDEDLGTSFNFLVPIKIGRNNIVNIEDAKKRVRKEVRKKLIKVFQIIKCHFNGGAISIDDINNKLGLKLEEIYSDTVKSNISPKRKISKVIERFDRREIHIINGEYEGVKVAIQFNPKESFPKIRTKRFPKRVMIMWDIEFHMFIDQNFRSLPEKYKSLNTWSRFADRIRKSKLLSLSQVGDGDLVVYWNYPLVITVKNEYDLGINLKISKQMDNMRKDTSKRLKVITKTINTIFGN